MRSHWESPVGYLSSLVSLEDSTSVSKLDFGHIKQQKHKTWAIGSCWQLSRSRAISNCLLFTKLRISRFRRISFCITRGNIRYHCTKYSGQWTRWLTTWLPTSISTATSSHTRTIRRLRRNSSRIVYSLQKFISHSSQNYRNCTKSIKRYWFRSMHIWKLCLPRFELNRLDPLHQQSSFVWVWYTGLIIIAHISTQVTGAWGRGAWGGRDQNNTHPEPPPYTGLRAPARGTSSTGKN